MLRSRLAHLRAVRIEPALIKKDGMDARISKLEAMVKKLRGHSANAHNVRRETLKAMQVHQCCDADGSDPSAYDGGLVNPGMP